MKDFKDKVAVITGAGRGIGRGIALRCAKEGMKIVLAGFGKESITKTAADLNALGTETLIVQTDVSVLADIENLAEKSYETFGAVDLLVNNAGVTTANSLLTSTMDDWHWVMGVNFYGVLHGVHVFTPRMIAQETTSHIVNISSLLGIAVGEGIYSVSKHAVVTLTEALHAELEKEAPHVKATVYCPGWVSTEIDTGERSRPARFKKNEIPVTEETRKFMRESLAGGISIEESADILFNGLVNDKLYVGPKAFESQLPKFADHVRNRTENILNENIP